VIKGVIATTDLLTRVMGTPSKLAQALRDTVFPLVSRLSPFQRRFVQNLSELGISYRGSPIILGSGNRYFDDAIRGGKGVCSRFLLLLGDDATSSAKEAAARLCESWDDLVELRFVKGQGMMLLRPDGYLALVAPPGDFNVDLESIRSLLKRQTQ
jgi:hypothetical protein